jgi:hypothetical protein
MLLQDALKPISHLAVSKGSRVPYSKDETERLRLAAAAAGLGVAKARAVDIESGREHLQWQAEELQKVVLQLRVAYRWSPYAVDEASRWVVGVRSIVSIGRLAYLEPRDEL